MGVVSPGDHGRARLLGALAGVMAVAVYLNALRNPFVFDDHLTVVTNASIRDLWDVQAIVRGSVFRPLENLTFALDYAVWGLNPFGFHLTSLLLHAVNVLLLFALTSRAVLDGRGLAASGADSGPSAAVPAFVAAALFAVHPVMTEAVGYVSGRAEVLCGTFFLLAVLAMRDGLVHRRSALIATSLVAFGLAVVAKEVAIMFPFVLLAYDRLLLRHMPGAGRRLLRLHLPLGAVMILAGTARTAVFLWLEQPSPVEALDRMARYLMLQLEVIWRYVALLVMPSSQSVFHTLGLSPRISLAGAAGLLVVGVAVYRLRRRAPLPAFGIAWFLLVLVPSSSIVPLQYAMAEHRVYLASAGLFVVAATGFAAVLALVVRRPVPVRVAPHAVLAVVLAALSVLTVARNNVWADTVTLWRDAVGKAPSWQSHMSLGDALREQGRCDEAIPAYRDAIGHAPRRLVPYARLRACLIMEGWLGDARQVGDEMLRRDPDFTRLCRELRAMAPRLVRLEECKARYRTLVTGAGGSPPSRPLP